LTDSSDFPKISYPEYSKIENTDIETTSENQELGIEPVFQVEEEREVRNLNLIR